MMMLEPPRKQADGAALVAPAEAWRVLGLSRAGLSRFLHVAQAAIGLRGEVDVLLTGNRTLRRLNREFRGKDKPTDVLSFPAAVPVAETPESHAGDLAISLETAQAQANEHGHSLRDEVRVLLLHGLLHLAGMDHEADRGEMAMREAELRQTLGLPSGLIARAASSRAGKRPRTLQTGSPSRTPRAKPGPRSEPLSRSRPGRRLQSGEPKAQRRGASA